jgi:hypothetical protein
VSARINTFYKFCRVGELVGNVADVRPPNFCQIQENNDRRIAHRDVLACELQSARVAIHLEHGDVVCTLIAAIEELVRRVEVETAWIIPTRPLIIIAAAITCLSTRQQFHRSILPTPISGMVKHRESRQHVLQGPG